MKRVKLCVKLDVRKMLVSYRFACVTAVQGFQIFKYTSPVVSIKEGKGWIIDGSFKLVHVIDLERFDRLLDGVAEAVTKNLKEEDRKPFIEFHLQQIRDRINLLRAKPSRMPRSIDWIGSAWKWVAGNPDAADWNKILQSEQDITDNNNHQYKINDKLFGITQEITQKINWVIDRFNKGVKDTISGRFEQDILNEILVIKGEVNEIVRACQVAKNGIINTNLLDVEEINRIISEVETLPYGNEVEAIEYGTPSIFSNNSMLLYVLSIPKVRKEEYNLLLTRPSIIDGKQIDLNFNRMLVNHRETYGIRSSCLSISNSTICEEMSLERIPEDNCIVKLLKGGPTTCAFRTNTAEIVELIKADTIFLTNFKGQLTSGNVSRSLMGTYVIQINNETIQLKNRTYSSSTSTTLQALPPVLANITNKVHMIDLGYVHGISMKNIEHLSDLTRRFNFSWVIDATMFLCIAIIAFTIFRRINRKLDIPAINLQLTKPDDQGNQP